MRAFWFQLAVALILPGFIAGCGGNSSTISPPPPLGITATFAGATPASAAVQVGSGAFTPMTLQGSQLSFTVPSGTTRYAVAYVCPRTVGSQTITAEFVIQATVQDGTSLSPACPRSGGGAPSSATVAVDATAISGATEVVIVGNRGIGATLNSPSGSITVNLPPGMNDIAIIALNGPFDTLAVRILRSQTVPGAVNGGNTVVLDSNDLVVNQPFMVNNVPANFSTPVPGATYHTAGGTSFMLPTNATAEYPAVPPASAQSGDFYEFEALSTDAASPTSAVSVAQSGSGGPVTLTLPPAWLASAPTPSALPTFSFNYSGFSGGPTAEIADIDWANSTLTASTEIRVIATSSFQNGATTITIPDLSSLSGFPAPAPSGANILWSAEIFNTIEVAPFASSTPMNVTLAIVSNFGSYIVP